MSELLSCAVFIAALTAQPSPSHASSPVQIELSLSKDHLVLGRDRKAKVTAEVSSETCVPKFETSLGEVSAPRKLGKRQYVVDYVPPKPTYPQVAIISARCSTPEGVGQGWRALPLWGTGDAVVKTTPHTSVSVTIGERSFGPRRANAQGVALIPIEVPPGVRVGMAEGREIDLGVPDTKHIVVSISSIDAPAHEEAEIRARIYVIDEVGAPRDRVRVELEASRGSISAPKALSPGEFSATWRLPPGPAGHESLIGRIKGEPASSARAKLERLPGPAAAMRIEFEPAVVVAGDTAEVVVTAMVLDVVGNITAGAVEWTSAPAEPVASEQPEAGLARLKLAVPTDLAGQRAWSFEARLKDQEGVRARAQLSLRAGAPQHVAFDPSGAGAIVSEGQGQTLRVMVRDRFGNPVTDAALATETEVGSVDAVREAEPGTYLLAYQAPWATLAERTRVSARAGEVSGSTVLTLHQRPRYLGLGLKLGGLSDLGRYNALYVAGEATAWWPWREEAFGLGLELGGFFFNRDYAVPSGALQGRSVSASNSFVPLLGMLGWRRQLLEVVYVWLQVGVGASYVSSELRIHEQPALAEDAWVLTGLGTAGLGWRVWAGGPFVEGRYWVHQDPGLENLRGVLPAWMGAVGYRLEL